MGHVRPRTGCVIDGCGRTTSKLYSEWICPTHWQRLTRAEKAVWARIKRRDRMGRQSPKAKPMSADRYFRIWRWCKRTAGS
jgi:hypothetical protein